MILSDNGDHLPYTILHLKRAWRMIGDKSDKVILQENPSLCATGK